MTSQQGYFFFFFSPFFSGVWKGWSRVEYKTRVEIWQSERGQGQWGSLQGVIIMVAYGIQAVKMEMKTGVGWGIVIMCQDQWIEIFSGEWKL